MAKVPLTFRPPTDPDIVRLHIFESDNPSTGFTEIDSVAAGVYPEYITHYTTLLASAADDWFAIQWENAQGVLSPISASVKGGTTTLIGELIERVLLRSPELDENIVAQEVEATLSYIYKKDDPYIIDPVTVNFLWMTELTNLALAASLYVVYVQDTARARDYTAGMISERNTLDPRALDNIERLERRALRRLGIGGSLIASISVSDSKFQVTGTKTNFDASRLLSTRQTLVADMVIRDIPSGDLLQFPPS